MSLIGDALRKARLEAAERDSDRRGILFSAKIADSPARSNLGLGLALGALIAVIATVAGGAAVWWVLGAGDADPDPSRSTASAAAVDPASDPASGGSVSGSEQPQRTAAETASETAAGTGTAAGTAAEADPGSVSGPVPVPVPVPENSGSEQRQRTAAAETTAAASEAAAASVPATGTRSGFAGMEGDEEVFILEADLGNGVGLSLDFLVFREQDPFAEINGVEVHLGGTIEGFRVKAIERDRVTLSNGRRTIVLRAP